MLDVKVKSTNVEESFVKDLFIQGTKETPEVLCRKESSEINIKGFCILSNPRDFLVPLNLWVENYINICKPENICLAFHLGYINGCSEKCIYDFIKFTERTCGSTTKLNIRCYYEEDDIDMYEWCKQIKSVFKVPVNVLKTV